MLTVKLRLTAVSDAQHGGFTTNLSPASWGSRRAVRQLDNAIAAVPHGFRSSFRDWAAERTSTPREVVEAALAHTVQTSTEAAYARSDLFERRRRLMDGLASAIETR